MIPLKLTVRNFLCYRDNVPALDLRGVHIACLCGDNGHGKSALLDAITWCLWGQARTGGRNYDALITHGESECRVELDFQARGQEYRVMRRRRRSGRGQSQADVFVLDDADNPRPITGNTLNETNAKIQQIVGMNYETFVNASFLAQGRSDEFMRKSPGERKDALSGILGLELYDGLQAAAREGRDKHRVEVEQTGQLLERTKEALDALPDPSDELAQIGVRVTELAGELEAKAAGAERTRAEVERLRGLQAQLESAAAAISVLQSDIRQADADAAAAEGRIAAMEAVIARTAEIGKGIAELNAARQALRQMEDGRVQYERLADEMAHLQQTVAQVEAWMQADCNALARRIGDEVAPLAGRRDAVSARLNEVRQQESALAAEKAAIDAQSARITELRQESAATDARLAQCVEEGKTLRARQNDIAAADAVCPLCGTPLADDACANIVDYYQARLNEMLQTHGELTAAKKSLDAEIAELSADNQRRSGALARQQREQQRGQAQLEDEYGRCAQAQELLKTLNPELAESQRQLSEGDFAPEERGALAVVAAELAELGYDSGARQQAFDRTQALQGWETAQAELNGAMAALPNEQSAWQRVTSQAQRWRAELQDAEGRLAANQAAVVNLTELERQIVATDRDIAGLRGAIAEASQRQGALLASVQARQQHQDEMARLTERNDAAQREFAVYSELFAAFGRTGIPAMLIDAAVPRIETEANLLLARMTDGRMAVNLETQRANQAGGMTETLDILVSDELGTRSYEVFSGGEAFRINLALRIALSKVLSQRMGVPLPTLFIDEGFGTQDAAGRERIVDTIASIQEQFEKIIVITHLEDLKNLFDVHIQVQKFDAGSQFELVTN